MIFREDLVKLEERFRSSDICVPPLLSGPFFVNDQSSIFPQIPAHSKSQFRREPGGVDVDVIYHVRFQFGGIFGLLEILLGGDRNERQQDGVNHSYNSDNKQANRYGSEYDNSAIERSRGAIDPITQGVHKKELR